MKKKPSQKKVLWVTFKPNAAVQVPTTGCVFFDDVINACVKQYKFELGSYLYSLSLTDGGPALSRGDSWRTEPGLAQNDYHHPLFLTLTTHSGVELGDESNMKSIPNILRKFGLEFSMRDVNYILNHDKFGLYSLLSPNLGRDAAKAILISAQSKVKSATKLAIKAHHSFFLDGSLHVAEGQGKSSLYYAFSETARVFVAKVYNGHIQDFSREVDANRLLNHKNLVKFVKTFSIGDRHIIVMPFYPRSVSDMILQEYDEIPFKSIGAIARGCFDALCHLHSKGLCFADLKPSNIMLQNNEPAHVVLIDYGATVGIGKEIIEFTDKYCLDTSANSTIATEHLDWICLGTTLAQLGHFDISHFNKADALAKVVLESHREEPLKQLILSCLKSPSLAQIQSSLVSFERFVGKQALLLAHKELSVSPRFVIEHVPNTSFDLV